MLMSPSQFSSLHLVSNNLVTCFGELFSCAQLLPSRLRIIVTCNGRTNISLLIFKWARCSRWRATNQPGIDASALWLGVGGNGCMFGLAFVSECSCVSVCECWIGKSLWAVSRVDFFRHHYRGRREQTAPTYSFNQLFSMRSSNKERGWVLDGRKTLHFVLQHYVSLNWLC